MFKNRPSLVQQVTQKLLNNITSGTYEKEFGGRLPSEPDLAKDFGVSRSTIRDAITGLVAEGIIARRSGVGTFVNRPTQGSLRTWPYEKSSFLQLIRQAGQEPSMQIISCGLSTADDWALQLGIEPDDQMLAMEKVHYSNRVPVIYTLNVVPLRLVLPNHLDEVKANYKCEESVYTFLLEKCDREVAYHDSDIQAGLSSEENAELLGVKPGVPVLKLDEVAYDQTNTPLFGGRSFLRSDKISFRIRRGLSLGLSELES